MVPRKPARRSRPTTGTVLVAAVRDLPAWKQATMFGVGVVVELGTVGRWLFDDHTTHGLIETGASGVLVFVGLFLMFPRGAVYLLQRVPLPRSWRRGA